MELKLTRLPASKNQGFNPVELQNADTFIATILTEKLATFTELKESIDLEEALDLWEIAIVNRYNEALAIESANRKR